MIEVPSALAAGGVWRWGAVDIDWRFEAGDMWSAGDVANVVIVPFVGDQAVVVKGPWGYMPVGGTLEPGEHWCNAATRELREEAGASVLPTLVDRPVLHPFGAFRCRSHAPAPYRDHLPWPDYGRVVAWAEVQLVGPPTQPAGGERIDEVLVVDVDVAVHLLEANSEVDACLYRMAADLRARGVDDMTCINDTVHLLEEHYVRQPTATGQSGKLGDPADWEVARRVVVDAIHHDGTFIDLGCANGLLMESVHAWASAEGFVMEPYGLDLSERLVALARRRLPRWQDRIYVGNALTWQPPRRFDFVHAMEDLVPRRRRAAWFGRLREEFVAPGGRLIVRGYEGVSESLMAMGLPVAGRARREREGKVAVEVAWVEGRPLV